MSSSFLPSFFHSFILSLPTPPPPILPSLFLLATTIVQKQIGNLVMRP